MPLVLVRVCVAATPVTLDQNAERNQFIARSPSAPFVPVLTGEDVNMESANALLYTTDISARKVRTCAQAT